MGLLVLVGLIVILLIVVGLIRVAARLAVAAVALFVAWTLLGGSLAFLMPWNEGPGTFGVVASSEGGWDVTIPAVPDATEYRLLLDDDVALTRSEPGVVHVDDRRVADRDYLPGPTRKFRLITRTPQGRSAEKLTWCAPVVFLAARGTYEDRGQRKFGHGMGSRGWRTWMKLAQQLGVAPTAANVLPTIIGGGPVHYPGTVLATGVAGYSKSRDIGKEDLTERITTIKETCPESRIILFGYSQGADVVASVWQEDTTDPTGFLGVVSFADPHFNRRWTGQLAVQPEGGKWAKNGMLGTRPKWDDSEIEGLQVWCLPGDPVCQNTKTLKDWHGWEYDCYEDWAAFQLAERAGPFLNSAGWNVSEPTVPECTPATRKSKDSTVSYEPDPEQGVA
jgi:hypothetical protein